ncbi:MAG: hypothetical protein H0W13_02230 [Nitrospirales bacterium]|nr:hypothetical protein [Nitrospirales bacterium]
MIRAHTGYARGGTWHGGEVIEPGIIQRRLVRESELPEFVERATGRRKVRRARHIVPI